MAARYNFGEADASDVRQIDRGHIRELSLRAHALEVALAAYAEGSGPVDSELRFELIRSSRELAERIRQVTL
jgi:hypothetical protein